MSLAETGDLRHEMLAQLRTDPKLGRIAYKDGAFGDIAKLRRERNQYRRTNNLPQAVRKRQQNLEQPPEIRPNE